MNLVLICIHWFSIKFAPGEWIRNAIRQRTQTSKPEDALERQEARKEAVAKGEASLFDTVQQEMESGEDRAGFGSLAAAKKAHSEVRFNQISKPSLRMSKLKNIDASLFSIATGPQASKSLHESSICSVDRLLASQLTKLSFRWSSVTSELPEG